MLLAFDVWLDPLSQQIDKFLLLFLGCFQLTNLFHCWVIFLTCLVTCLSFALVLLVLWVGDFVSLIFMIVWGLHCLWGLVDGCLIGLSVCLSSCSISWLYCSTSSIVLSTSMLQLSLLMMVLLSFVAVGSHFKIVVQFLKFFWGYALIIFIIFIVGIWITIVGCHQWWWWLEYVLLSFPFEDSILCKFFSTLHTKCKCLWNDKICLNWSLKEPKLHRYQAIKVQHHIAPHHLKHLTKNYPSLTFYNNLINKVILGLNCIYMEPISSCHWPSIQLY